MKNLKSNFVYLHHIQEAIGKISRYLDSHDHEDFQNEVWDQDAVARNLARPIANCVLML